jgi:hypothetical protein
MQQPDKPSTKSTPTDPSSSLKEELKAWAARVQADVDRGKMSCGSPAPAGPGPTDLVFIPKKTR